MVASNADFAGMMGVANFGDGGGLSHDGFGETFDFEEQDGGAVARKTGVNEIFNDAERPAIEHFAGSGNDGAGGDVDDGFRGVIDGLKNGEKRFDGFGLAGEFEGNFSDESERAFGTDEEAGEVVGGGVTLGAANTNDFAVGEDELKSGNVIGGDAIG